MLQRGTSATLREFMRMRRACQRTMPLLLLAASLGSSADEATKSRFPFPQTLSYQIDWHLINAGTVNLEFKHLSGATWQIDLDIESTGVVTRLYRVVDKYTMTGNDRFCPSSALLDAQEGKKHTVTTLNFDAQRHTVDYHEHDALKNSDKHLSMATGTCTHEILGALAVLGQLDLQPGKSTTIPVTNGKKMVNARVQAEAKETISIGARHYETIRYEAFLFDNILYRRKGRVFLWISNDEERTPVQIRFELGFPIGNISLLLDKQQKS